MNTIIDYRNPSYTDATNTRVTLEVLLDTGVWFPTTIVLSATQQPHLQGAYDWIQANLSSVAPYVPDAEEILAELKEKIAEERYRREIGGMLFNGLPIATDHNSQAKITGAALQAVIDDTTIITWKTDSGPVPLDAPTVIAIAQAVRGHIQACFDREFAILAAVENGTYTETMLSEGWPSYA